jgi:hypothetical protein
MRAGACAVVVTALSVPLLGQERDASMVLEAVRGALGGEQRLSAVSSMTIEGRLTRVQPDGTPWTTGFEMHFELPDRFIKRTVVGQLGDAPITRRSGFNGADPIDEVDGGMAARAGGGRVVFGRGPGAVGGTATPEAREAALLAGHREHARLLLGMLGQRSPVYPLDLRYEGQAEADGITADILEVTAADGFAGQLFADASSGLPLFMRWMEEQPVAGRMGGPAGAMMGGRGGATVGGGQGGGVQIVGPRGGGAAPDAGVRVEAPPQADTERRVVEHRLFYAEHRRVDGVMVPRRIQLMIDGTPSEELLLDRVRLNRRIPADTFRVPNRD